MRVLLMAVVVLGFSGSVGAQENEASRPLLRVGYQLGYSHLFEASERERLLEGVRDARAGKPAEAPLSRMREGLRWLNAVRSSGFFRRDDEAEGLKYAATRKGAIVLPSGLIFTSLEEGSGPSPTDEDRVRVYYSAAWLSTGRPFETRHGRNGGTPAEFAMREVIPCWREGLQRMRVGGKALLTCPSALAYGREGRPSPEKVFGSDLEGGEPLRFKVELLAVARGSSEPAERPLAARRSAALDEAIYGLGYALAKSIALEDGDLAALARGLELGSVRGKVDFGDRKSGEQVLAARRKRQLEANQRAGAAWLQRLESESGALKLPSGALFIPVEEGTGRTPEKRDIVNYAGRATLEDGTEVWKSSPFDLTTVQPLAHVGTCLEEALGTMKAGGRARFLCPATGDDAARPFTDSFPPAKPLGATLMYELHLVKVRRPEDVTY